MKAEKRGKVCGALSVLELSCGSGPSPKVLVLARRKFHLAWINLNAKMLSSSSPGKFKFFRQSNGKANTDDVHGRQEQTEAVAVAEEALGLSGSLSFLPLAKTGNSQLQLYFDGAVNCGKNMYMLAGKAS